MKKLIVLFGLSTLFCKLAISQTSSGSVIEVEAKGRITFAPDSFVVVYRLNRSSVNLEDKIEKTSTPASAKDIREEILVQEAEYDIANVAVEEVPTMLDVVAEAEPPKTREEIEAERKLRQERQRKERIIQDSLNAIRSKRYDDFTKRLARMGIQKPINDRPMEVFIGQEIVSYYDEYSSEKWVQVVSSKQYHMADSLSRIFGNPLRGELIDIRMKSHDAIKKKAYAKAMENGRKEGEILASAMNLKLGKVVGVTTESLGLEEMLPIMLRKELSRELRRSDNLKPEMYQFMQEFDMNQFVDSKYGKEVIEWSWTEKVMIRFQANP